VPARRLDSRFANEVGLFRGEPHDDSAASLPLDRCERAAVPGVLGEARIAPPLTWAPRLRAAARARL